MPEYVIEQYVLYKMNYRVSGGSEAEAIWRVLDEQVAHEEESLECIGAAEAYGLPAEAYPQLCRELSTFDIPTQDVIPSIRSIVEIRPEPEAPRSPTLCLVLDSEPHGRESFDHYYDLDDMLAAVKRLVRNSQEQTAVDGVERTVGIAITLPSNDDEDFEDATDDLPAG